MCVRAGKSVKSQKWVIFKFRWFCLISADTKLKILQLLLKSGLNVDVINRSGSSAVLIAVTQYVQNDNNFIKELVSHGADLNLRNHKNKSALHVVCRSGMIYCFFFSHYSFNVMLFTYGADKKKRNKKFMYT